jgi:hypothetical protein
MREIGRHIADHSGPTERIAVLGSEPELFFYARRFSATGHIYMYGLMEPQPFARTMQQQMIREIEESAPAWLVVVSIPVSWLVRPDSDGSLARWAEPYVEKHYRPVGLVEILSPDSTAYTWGDPVSVGNARTPYLVVVYRRKPGA